MKKPPTDIHTTLLQVDEAIKTLVHLSPVVLAHLNDVIDRLDAARVKLGPRETDDVEETAFEFSLALTDKVDSLTSAVDALADLKSIAPLVSSASRLVASAGGDAGGDATGPVENKSLDVAKLTERRLRALIVAVVKDVRKTQKL